METICEFRLPSRTLVQFYLSIVLLAASRLCACAQTNIATEFLSNAVLNAQQIADVATLARKCGIATPRKIGTFYFLPGSQRGIEVTSSERISGRVTDYDTLTVYYSDWSGQHDPKAKEIGSFWANPPLLCTNHFVTFQIQSQSKRIRVDPEISVAIADKIMDCIVKGRVSDQGDPPSFTKISTNKIKPSKVDNIGYDKDEKGYRIYCGHNYFICKLIDDNLVIVSFGSWWA